ncbi:MAG: C45 family autoproteolytic acyltransferase/hydrolase [Rubrobacteraceae bacterium]
MRLRTPVPKGDTKLLYLAAVHEAEPGSKWQALFEKHWPHYKKWFLSEGHQARSGYVTSAKRLRTYMPELVPTYERLVELAGSGDLAARFLSFYRPPPYLMGCSQAVWTGQEPVLVRNYDYSPTLFEGTLLYTCWNRPVIATGDCLWGVLDGINDAGLAASLSFGGRKVTGDGFGVPLLLRYILELCDTVGEASETLRRVPVHMPYNVTVVDRSGVATTTYLSPDRPPITSHAYVSTNHQEQIEWEDHARMSSTAERKEFLEARLADSSETRASFIGRFLRPPLYNRRYERAFGTLYTAAYYPAELAVEYRWPHQGTLRQSFSEFHEVKRTVGLGLPMPKSKLVWRSR